MVRRCATSLCLAVLLAVSSTEAQFVPVPQTGLHYFAMENLTRGTVELRGVAGSNGIAHDNLALAPNTNYRHCILQAETLRTGFAQFSTPESGRRIELPPVFLFPPNSPDGDGDELTDDGELIMGTSADNPDSDGDGVKDGAEVRQGTNPLDGLPARTGIIATAEAPGLALDIAARNDIVAVAGGSAGVSLFNVFNGMDPLIVAQVDTPGNATRVAISGSFVAVADGGAGLAVIDMSDPPTAAIVHQLALGTVRAVTAGGGIAYVGLEDDAVAQVDLVSGAVLGELPGFEGPVVDLRLDADTLWALTPSRLYAILLIGGAFEVVGSVGSPFVSTANERLFVGGGVAYAVHGSGYNTFDIIDPTAPGLITAGRTGQRGWKQLVLNGSGVGVAAVSANRSFDGSHDVSLYDVSDPMRTDAFLTQFETPGVARALSIFNGLAYVADRFARMQVVNYLSFDALGVAPEISLRSNFALGAAEEGQPVRLTADVSDDVQVRNVEFYVDGVKVATDGNFPFEHRFNAPLLREQPSFTVYARASDTGGNSALSEEIAFELVPDATPPRVVRVSPPRMAILGQGAGRTVVAYFSEPIDDTTLTSESFSLFSAGEDGTAGDDDDVPVAGGALSYQGEALVALMDLGEEGLPSGSYRAVVGAPLADLAGNIIAADFAWTFFIYGDTDTDGDGVPDDLEILLGLDPDNTDSDEDGTPDGEEDFDNDGLSNAGEVILLSNPTVEDTDGDGVRDGDEDTDFDFVNDGDETRRGSDPLSIDTDGDGIADVDEFATGSDPTDAASRPPRRARSSVVSVLNALLGDPPTERSVQSLPVSYLNALLGEAGERFTTSQVVSYENQ